MEAKPVILVVEDEKAIRDMLTTILEGAAYKVISAATGKEAIALISSHIPSLVLLDLGLPDLDGLMVLDVVRQWGSMPIIVVSAREHEKQKVEALDLGADDYVTKPFSNDELMARIRTALRRSAQTAGGGGLLQFSAGALSIDCERRAVKLDGQDVHLTPIEYRILTLLASNAGRVLTHEFILREIWGPYSSDNQILRVNMANIRRKIEKNPGDPTFIFTEMGVGYRMAEPDADKD